MSDLIAAALEVGMRLGRYESLMAKMLAYQDGDVHAPSVSEFMQWREDVRVAIALRLKQAGLDDAVQAA